jgi:hypothetical protein
MKILSIVFVFLVSILLESCNSIVGPGSSGKWITGRQITAADDSKIPDSLKALFREDASILALRDVQSDPESKETLIILPPELLKFYYYGLIHVYNAFSLPARDSVIDIYKIHTFPNPQPHDLDLYIDSTKSWAHVWREGNRLTGNQQIDYLMQKYNLQFSRYYDFPWGHSVALVSAEPINVFALGKKFELINGIFHAGSNGYYNESYDIKSKIGTNYLLLKFNIGWGDCPSGCIAKHYWEFQVSFPGSVKFIKSYGDPIPRDISHL